MICQLGGIPLIMFQRVCDIQEPLIATPGFLHITNKKKWNTINEVTKVLKRFEQITGCSRKKVFSIQLFHVSASIHIM